MGAADRPPPESRFQVTITQAAEGLFFHIEPQAGSQPPASVDIFPAALKEENERLRLPGGPIVENQQPLVLDADDAPFCIKIYYGPPQYDLDERMIQGSIGPDGFVYSQDTAGMASQIQCTMPIPTQHPPSCPNPSA